MLNNLVSFKHDNLRLHNISRLNLERQSEEEPAVISLPVSQGLAIEYCDDVNGKPNSFVIAFIRYCGGDCHLESVGSRLTDYVTPQTYETFKSLVDIGMRCVELANEKELECDACGEEECECSDITSKVEQEGEEE